jgi:hypothetical protein
MNDGQDACAGKKWNMKVRAGWSASQAATSERCELTGSSSRWMELVDGSVLVYLEGQ